MTVMDAGSDTLDSVRSIERELSMLMRRMRAAKEEIARLIDTELAASTYTVLVLVAEHQPTQAREIIEMLDMDKSAISRHLTALDELGLIHRGCDPEDRRTHTLSLTARGEEKVHAAVELRRSKVHARLHAWSSGELDSFAAQLARFNADLEA